MHTINTDLQQVLSFAPEWAPLWRRLEETGIAAGAAGSELGKGSAWMCAFLTSIGAKSLFAKLSQKDADADTNAILLKSIRDCYLVALANKMFRSNANLRRFTSEKRQTNEECRSLQMSLAVEVAFKLEAALRKQILEKREDGFRVLLPAYVQSSVNNAVIDYIKQESHWDKQTQNDSYSDGEEENPIDKAPDDLSRIPEQLILSKEKVKHLNELRAQLEKLLPRGKEGDPALCVVDCIFGLGLTANSKLGMEMTMRECCNVLQLEGETQARKIARCQVLLDKGLNRIRDLLRESLPDVIQCWQQEVNVNVASRRDLNHQLSLTEGEIERLIVSRQYMQIEQLVEKLVLKAEKLQLLKEKGAVAAFVPIDLNTATVRDLVDVLALSKETAQKITSMRPFERFGQLSESKLLSESQLATIRSRGAVLKLTGQSDGRLDLNQCTDCDLSELGINIDRAALIIRGRPFQTWVELEEFLACDEPTWLILRNNFRLGLKPA